MRSLVVLASAALVFCAASSAQIAKPVRPSTTEKLPVFSFMGDTTETPTARTSFGGEPCSGKDDKLECADYGDPKLGDATLEWLSLTYNHGLLYRVMGSLRDHQYPALLEALTTKYGQPKTTTEKWQSKGGAIFDNAVSRWQFRDGTLQLDSMGSEVGKASLLFLSQNNSPKHQAPSINF